MKFFAVIPLAFALAASARPLELARRQDFKLKNGQDALALNAKFATLTAASACTNGEMVCVTGQFGQCVGGKLVLTPCAAGLQCVALPLVNSAGTSVTCDTTADRDARIAATGATAAAASPAVAAAATTTTAAAANNAAAAAAATTTAAAAAAPAATTAAAPAAASGDAQTSLTLLQTLVQTNTDGAANLTSGQVVSVVSKNNFINFCATVNKPLTNGQQVLNGSCNPIPMGVIAAKTNIPSSKFAFPTNGDTTLKANTTFTVLLNVANLETGKFTNAQETYYAAPQTVNAQGNIVGHTHVVIQKLTALNQTTILDNQVFTFFKGVDAAAANGQVQVVVTGGIPKGFYKISSINTAANHQPALVAVAQHGHCDDQVYFTVN